jgi:hypothetical protein
VERCDLQVKHLCEREEVDGWVSAGCRVLACGPVEMAGCPLRWHKAGSELVLHPTANRQESLPIAGVSSWGGEGDNSVGACCCSVNSQPLEVKFVVLSNVTNGDLRCPPHVTAVIASASA